MKKILFILAGLIFTTLIAQSKPDDDPFYPASLISDSLKDNANAVIREKTIEYTYVSINKNILKYRMVVTVLNKNGDHHARFVRNYDNQSSINNISIKIYDAAGNEIRNIKQKEIKDYSGSAGYPEFDDVRYKSFTPLISNYPYTVEYEYRIDYSGSYHFPTWIAINSYNVSVEKSCLRINIPVGYKLNYKQFNLDPEKLKVETNKTNILYSWCVEDLKAIDDEPFEDNIINYSPAVYTAPSDFIHGGYSGNLDTWDNYATWRQQLNYGRDVLSETRAAEIRLLTKDLQTDKDKVKELYHYLQSRTRYFSIQFGIGNLQPMEATVVDEVGYSDCKGLSNYMRALLNVIGIKSYYAAVNAGDDFPQIIADFPSHQSNHVILCVPLTNDTVWLECTSQVSPFNFLGAFTSNRQVLLVKETGGEIVRTPVYSLEDNYQTTNAFVKITPEGNALADVTRKFGGLQFDIYMDELHLEAEEQKRWLYQYLNLPNYQINQFNFRQDDHDQPESALTISSTLNSYVSSSGKRIFLPLNLMNRSEYIPKKIKRRWGDIIKKVSYIDIDSIVYAIPDGTEVEFLPEKTEINTPFGEYLSYSIVNDNTIIYYRKVKMFQGTFPKDKYEELIEFYRDINVADKIQAVLVKSES